MALGRAATVALLFGISLMNYLDRYSVSAVLNEIQAPSKADGSGGFGLDDSQAGLISSVFVLGYLIASPLFGYAGDRMPRIPLLFLGTVVYSVSAFLSSMCAHSWQFLIFRSAVGVGEASFAVLAPTLIADLYPNPQRTTVLGIYCISVPLGSAAGFITAGEASRLFGWRYAFRFSPVVSFILAALLLLAVPEPLRGGTESAADPAANSPSRKGISKPATAALAGVTTPGNMQSLSDPGIRQSLAAPVTSPALAIMPISSSLYRDVLSICNIPTFRWATAGAVGMVFAAGALSSWAVPSLQRFNCIDADARVICEARVNRLFGTSTMMTGVLGTFFGSQVARWYGFRDPAADSLVCAASLFLASPFLYASIYLAPSWHVSSWISIFVGTFAVCMVWAPNLSVLLSITRPNQRGTASSISLLVTHLFGDSMSPLLVGWAADVLHEDNGLSKAVALQHSLFMTVVATTIGSVCFYIASFHLQADRAAALQDASISGRVLGYTTVAGNEEEDSEGILYQQQTSRQRRGLDKSARDNLASQGLLSLEDESGGDQLTAPEQTDIRTLPTL
jgi:MFS transporter, Spinster family, sphingosine-1-phosphate transporter